MNLARLLPMGLLALAVVGGAGWWLQGQAAEALRAELAMVRDERAELVKLQAENRRLAAAQVSADELARLRGDHAAVARLRGEIEKLKDELQARERALAAGGKGK